jgi:16S rRNA (cytosine1402-N4)-methyltransferase
MPLSDHIPVLYQNIILALNPKSRGRYDDGTFGAGRHAAGILKVSSPDGEVLGLDVDPQALEIARNNLSEFGARVIIIKASYTTLTEQLAKVGWTRIDGMLLDLGASSMQFDTPERGFSFQAAGDLDMRFDPTNALTATHLVNDLPESELANLIFRYGEEPRSRQIAKAIVAARPVSSTVQLAEIISSISPIRDRLHPATRTFMALRIAVNDELISIEKVLPQAIQSLAIGGRLAVISFHSLEDRLVKGFFRQESKDCLCPPRQPMCTCGHKASIREVNRRPIIPTDLESSSNPRARSAKLRVVEKI